MCYVKNTKEQIKAKPKLWATVVIMVAMCFQPQPTYSAGIERENSCFGCIALFIWRNCLHVSLFSQEQKVCSDLRSLFVEILTDSHVVFLLCRVCCLCLRSRGWWRFLWPTAPTTWAVESVCCLEIPTVLGPDGSVGMSGWLLRTGESSHTNNLSGSVSEIRIYLVTDI